MMLVINIKVNSLGIKYPIFGNKSRTCFNGRDIQVE